MKTWGRAGGVWMLAVVFVLVVSTDRSEASGPYVLPPVVVLTGTVPGLLQVPELQINCIGRVETGGGTASVHEICYRGTAIGNLDGPLPPPFYPANPDVLVGNFNSQAGVLLIPLLNCTMLLPELAASSAIGIQLDKSGAGTGSVVVTTDTTSPFDCAGAPQTTGPLTLTPLAQSTDTDGDGCADWEELGDTETAGGLRDPFNPWDFYDVWTHDTPTTWEKDGSVDLFGDIYGVIDRFGTSGDPNGDPNVPPTDDTSYHVAFDRGAAPGPDLWNIGPADGTIDLFEDIMAVSYQFGHACSAAP